MSERSTSELRPAPKMVSYRSVFDQVLQAVLKHYKYLAKNFSKLRRTSHVLNCRLMRPVTGYLEIAVSPWKCPI